MVEMQTIYRGQLHCDATHGPSGAVISTDAPRDNQGLGEAFSPTDLVATALGTCMLTTMGIVAKRLEVDFTGARATVRKEMVADPLRRIGSISVDFHLPAGVSADNRQRLENAAMTCPVHKSLHPNVAMPITFTWAD